MANNFFTITSFFYSLLLMIVYFKKKRIKTLENKLYAFLVVINFINIFFAIACYFTITNKDIIPIINEAISKILLLCFFAWVTIFTIYVIIITSRKDDNYISKQLTFGAKSLIFIYFLCISIITFMLPLYYFSENRIVYSYGPSANGIYLISSFYMLIWLVCMVKNYKIIKNKKYIPVIAFMFLMLVVMIIQKMFPGLLLITATQTFITFLMYFTIENPDMKLIRELDIARERAENANIAKTDFLSSMSHEIRTPLNAIVGLSQVLLTEDLTETAKEEVMDILNASDNLLEIVNGILDISKIEADKLEIVDVEYCPYKIFNELISLIKIRMKDKNIKLETKFAEDIPPMLYGDSMRVKQIILNLLTNSVKYTKSGTIDFTVKCVKKGDICRLFISVKDTGIGIKKENINKLFTKFERFDMGKNNTIEGTGLGLAITKRLVELMNGQIVVNSIYGEGSCFTVALDQKVISNIESATLVEEEKEDIVISSNKRILLIDDNTVNLKVATKLLSKYNVSITTGSSGFECIDILASDKNYDLILLDDMMPKMSGVETLNKLKEDANFNIPVVALTANAISGMREKYLESGFDDYLSKPIIRTELERIIKKFLG